jgi:hypothetical protein
MTPLDITMNLATQPWGDLRQGMTKARHVPLERIGLLPSGTNSGRPTVELMATVHGRPVIFETTYRMLRTAMRCFAATPDGMLADLRDELEDD